MVMVAQPYLAGHIGPEQSWQTLQHAAVDKADDSYVLAIPPAQYHQPVVTLVADSQAPYGWTWCIWLHAHLEQVKS
jgi:hypothetical protein